MNAEEFEQLSDEDQEKIFHQTPFRERGELFLHSHHPERLIKSLSQEELYLLTREMDFEERGEVLRYANLPQLFFISDMDCWKKDRLDPRRFVQWLETLLEADERRLLAWLVEMDYETVVTGFKNIIRVLKPEWEYPSDEILGDLPFFTLDERYFISVKEENIETVRRSIEILFENNKGRYTVILEGVMGELEYEAEEEAFQNRATRLAERGFPDSETAHHIYRPLSKEEFDRFPPKNSTKEDREARSLSGGFSQLARVLKEKLFLDEVLLFIREEPLVLREKIEEELAWLTNKVIACEGIDFASEERVRDGIERARHFVSIGLELLSAGDLQKAGETVKERWLEIIFRWGATELLTLRTEAYRVVDQYWKGEKKSILYFLDGPYGSILQGLLRAIPACYDPEVKDQVESLREFKNVRDIDRIRKTLIQIKRIHEFLADKFPSLFHRLNLEMTQGNPQTNLFSLLGTIFAHFSLNGKLSSSPLTLKELERFRKKGLDSKEEFLNQFFSNEDQEILRFLWAIVFEKINEELLGLEASREVNPRYVTALCVSVG